MLGGRERVSSEDVDAKSRQERDLEVFSDPQRMGEAPTGSVDNSHAWCDAVVGVSFPADGRREGRWPGPGDGEQVGHLALGGQTDGSQGVRQGSQPKVGGA